jgi:hypothetical protein
MQFENLLCLALQLVELLPDVLCLCQPLDLATQAGDLGIEPLLDQPILHEAVIDLRSRRGSQGKLD